MEAVESSLLLATLAAEAIHGRAQVRLHGRFRLDLDDRRLYCETESPVGDTIASVFTCVAGKMMGEDSIVVEDPGPSATGSFHVN